MKLHLRSLRFAIILCAVTVAKADVAFSYRNAPNQTPTPIGNLGQMNTAATSVGSTSTITLIMQNTATTSTNLTDTVIAGPGFAAPALPSTIPAGGTAVLIITFSPQTAGNKEGSVSLSFKDETKVTSYTFFLNGTAVAPLLITSYVLNPTGNQIPFKSGDTIRFAPTEVNRTATASINVVNLGNGPGQVNSVTLSGAGFSLTNLPLLPATVTPGAILTFGVGFTPTARGEYQGKLDIQLGNTTVSVQMAGQGAGIVLTYEVVTGGNTIPVASGGTITVPNATVGSSSSVKVQVRNTGELAGTVSSVSLTGTGFTLPDLPPLPSALPPGGSYIFAVLFSPKTSGAATATLFIDSFRATVVATGNGSQMTLASRNGSTVTSVPEGGTVIFPNITLGTQGSLTIIVTNAGNASGTVNGISVSGTAFSLQGLPTLPASLDPGASIQFTVLFAPTALGAVTGGLLVDTASYGLRGIADAPPTLGSVTFPGLASSAQPLQQPSFGIALSEPYPFELIGRVTLTVQSDSFVADPSVQFVTGGRTAPFRIPANTLVALFGSNNSQQTSFQTGTVAGTITLTAGFSLGSVDITPAPPPSRPVAIASTAPQITNLTLGTITGSAFEVLITGYSTPRTMSQLNLQFTPAPGSNLQTTALSVNVAAAFGNWFQSVTGSAFGSQFTASVPISYSGPISAVRVVAVSLQNTVGTSNVTTVNMP